MTITRKEVITKIHVEISREEFVDNYTAMMFDIYNKRRVNTRVLTEKVVKFCESSTEVQNQMAQDSFTSLFGEIHSATLRYIAESNGLSIENYGFVNRHTGMIECTMVQNGAHL